MPAAGLYRRIELADGHIQYEPVDDEIERLKGVIAAYQNVFRDLGLLIPNPMNKTPSKSDYAAQSVGPERLPARSF